MDKSTSHVSDKNGIWIEGEVAPVRETSSIETLLLDVTQPLVVVEQEGEFAFARGGVVQMGGDIPAGGRVYPLKAYISSLHPSSFGSDDFCRRHHLRYPYIAGAMANGIASVELVEVMGKAGLLGFFGAAGLHLAEVERAIDSLKQRLGDLPFGMNLIHSPNEPGLEASVVDCYLKHSIRLVSASAYLDLTLPLVHYRLKGIHVNAGGEIVCPNQVVAKVSRVEVAKKFFSPAPEAMLRQLVERGKLTQAEAELAHHVPIAQDLTAEADSGGHTDNRSVVVLLPTMQALRDECQETYRYSRRLCVGLAGGLSTPGSVAAAFAMGADYIVTGSINQSCVEAGTSETVKELLSQAKQADVAMAPAADMFEMGVKVQVLKWRTMFAVRARKLYELYRAYESLEAIPAAQRVSLERDYFRCSLEEAWEQTRQFFATVDPSQNERAQADPKHRMALVFRSYLGRASKWANAGEPTRAVDYQIWCGPAMGAFNAWVKGSFLAPPAARKAVTLAMNLMLGAAVMGRLNQLRLQGVELPQGLQRFRPMSLDSILGLLKPGEPERNSG